MSDPLVSGIGVCPGVVRGEAKVLRSERDIEELRPGKIIVIPHSSPLYAVALMSASGVICENGGEAFPYLYDCYGDGYSLYYAGN